LFYYLGGDISEFVREGELLKCRGGVFQLKYDGDLRISAVYFSFPGAKEYVDSYCDFYEIDGTFGLSKYDFINLKLLVVDCLGKSRVRGEGLVPSESTEYTVETIQMFGMNKEGMVHLRLLLHLRILQLVRMLRVGLSLQTPRRRSGGKVN
jgi:hypothetical protein